MKIPIELSKMWAPPAAKKCFNCSKLKPLFTLDRDIAVFSKAANAKLSDVKLKLYNYSALSNNMAEVKIDLSKPCEIRLEKYESILKSRQKPMTAFYNPDCNGTIYVRKLNKKTGQVVKKPLQVNILRSEDGAEITYHFMKKDLSKELGYVCFLDLKKEAPSLNREGLSVSFLQNWDDKKYSGIGELADRLEVEYCLKNNMKPRITSDAEVGSHIAHFKRGKRFCALKKDSTAYSYFQEKFNCTDLNKIIKGLLKKSDGKKIDISDWGWVDMYLSKKMIEKYTQMIKENPIL